MSDSLILASSASFLKQNRIPTCPVVRFKYGASRGGSDRSQKAPVRHLGEHGQRGQQDGQHRGSRLHPGKTVDGTRDFGTGGKKQRLRREGAWLRKPPGAGEGPSIRAQEVSKASMSTGCQSQHQRKQLGTLRTMSHRRFIAAVSWRDD